MTDEQSLPRGRWLFAWFVACALFGEAVGALTAYFTYTPSNGGFLDFSREALTVGFAALGLLFGLAVAFVTSLVFIIYRMFGRDGID